jgi:SepF-like predicted cell division protein (DUF552 family)
MSDFYPYESVDKAERARARLAAEAELESVKPAKRELTDAVTYLAELLECADSPDELSTVVDKLRDTADEVERLASVWTEAKRELGDQ